MLRLSSIAEVKKGLEAIAESTMSQTAAYKDLIIVNVLESILRTAKKTITIDVTGKQAHPKQIVFFRQDILDEDDQIKFSLALKFAEIFIDLYNQKFGKTPLGTDQQNAVNIREQGEEGEWYERHVNLITLRHPENVKILFMHPSGIYYRGIAQNILDGFVKIIEQQRDQA